MTAFVLPQPRFAPRRYPHAPIKEALIDLQVVLPSVITVDTLQQIHKDIQAEFPTQEKRFFVESQFTVGDQVGSSTKQRHMGYIFYSADGRHAFQARLDGFTFSRLAPYESWESLRDQARRYWDIYRRHASPAHIHRIALRYINQINIPRLSVDFDDYFLTSVKIGPALPQYLSHFVMQLNLPQPDLSGIAILTATMAPPPDQTSVSVILDIAVFVERQEMSDADAWTLVEALRIRKNDLFEGSITDLTRELFA